MGGGVGLGGLGGVGLWVGSESWDGKGWDGLVRDGFGWRWIRVTWWVGWGWG